MRGLLSRVISHAKSMPPTWCSALAGVRRHCKVSRVNASRLLNRALIISNGFCIASFVDLMKQCSSGYMHGNRLLPVTLFATLRFVIHFQLVAEHA